MPHKRAKFSERMADRAHKGNDLPPSSGNTHFDSLPKGAMRILNAAKVQAEYREKKRQRLAEEAKRAKGKGKAEDGPLQIREGEKMADFHRRVENTMAKEVNSSIRATRDSNKKQKRKAGAQQEQGNDDRHAEVHRPASSSSKATPQEPDSKTLKRQREALEKGKGTQVDWEKASTRKRVNDVVDAPPTLTTAPRGETKSAKERKARLMAALSGKEAATTASAAPGARLPDPVQRGGLRREAMLQEERQRVVQAYRQNKQANLNGRS